MVNTSNDIAVEIWKLLEDVPDPEIPVLSIRDLGILRDVQLAGDEVIVTITPTYTGCPAMDAVQMDIRLKLAEHGYRKVKIRQVISPAWTTDWMTEEGKLKLKEYGIAPPAGTSAEGTIECPLCNSASTTLLSQFGSTACKALYQCNDCKEVFDYFKCH